MLWWRGGVNGGPAWAPHPPPKRAELAGDHETNPGPSGASMKVGRGGREAAEEGAGGGVT